MVLYMNDLGSHDSHNQRMKKPYCFCSHFTDEETGLVGSYDN